MNLLLLVRVIAFTALVLTFVNGEVVAQVSTSESEEELPEHAVQQTTRIFIEDGDLSVSGKMLILVAIEFDTEEHVKAHLTGIFDEEYTDDNFERSDQRFKKLTDEVVLLEDPTPVDGPTSVLIIQENEYMHAWLARGFEDPVDVVLDMYQHHYGGDRSETDILPTKDEVPAGLEPLGNP